MDKKNFRSIIELNFSYQPLRDFINKEYSSFLDSLEIMIADYHINDQDKPSFIKIGEDIFCETMNGMVNNYRKSLTPKGKNDLILSAIDLVNRCKKRGESLQDQTNIDNNQQELRDLFKTIQQSININIQESRWTKEEIENMIKIFKEKIPEFSFKLVKVSIDI